MLRVKLKLRSWLHTARMHVSTNDRYRRYPVYSLLLVLIVITTLYWPTTEAYLYTLFDHPGLLTLSRVAEAAALGLAIALALVGLLRRGWMPKVVSVLGLWWGTRLTLYWIHLPSAQDVWLDFTWIVFELPTARFDEIASGDATILTGLYALYLGAVYLILRPFVKASRGKIRWIQDKLLAKYPALDRWAQPIA